MAMVSRIAVALGHVALLLSAGCRLHYDTLMDGGADASLDAVALDTADRDGGDLDAPDRDGASDAASDATTDAPGSRDAAAPRCGDGVIDPGEACDGTSLDGLDCTTVAAGFRTGTLRCAADCSAFDAAACTPGDTIPAASCSVADVTAAVALAADGDTVQIPAGSCTWTNPSPGTPALEIDDRRLVLRGAGESLTTIVDDGGPDFGDTLIVFGGSTRAPVRVTGITFRRLRTEEGGAHLLAFFGPREEWRVDHCTFEMESVHGFVHSDGPHSGLVDHVTVRGRAHVWAHGSFADVDARWREPLGLGTRGAIYVEDSSFDDRLESRHHPTGAVYADFAARVAFRHNTVRDAPLGFQGPLITRGTFSYEIYDNTFVAETSSWTWLELGGGSGVVWGNSASGGWARFLLLDYVRSCEARAGGLCDGTSSVDGNVEPSGYPCRDQHGRSTDGPTGQALEGLYEWDNTDETGAVHFGVNVSRCAHMGDQIVAGRDHHATARPGYVPYPYPHPMARIEP